MELVFASNNKHKLEEAKALMGTGCTILSLSDIGCHDEIPEDKPDLVGNALQKAHYIYQKYHRDCFSDDTGMEIEALNGRPGVYSARYAGAQCSFEDNMNKVLEEMQPFTNRKACFRTVIALIMEGKEYLFEGRVDGIILREEQGKQGFGYDPIFQPSGYNISFAEMDLNEKNAISHRGRALEKLCRFLKAQNV
ncbi:MAG: non-canonical purine NTP diphosphatase [Bacteroidales bacterium]|jgi:XTP/dITP diphosphohydrolase|nr:non-canonical purine NTP diphosphatase [Bacteroidales bacterium]